MEIGTTIKELSGLVVSSNWETIITIATDPRVLVSILLLILGSIRYAIYKLRKLDEVVKNLNEKITVLTTEHDIFHKRRRKKSEDV